MPFPMTHICIADRIIALNPEMIKNLPQFYLGTLAPDSVHFRKNYISEYKIITHLCVGNEKWGEFTNNSEWIDNVLSFLINNKQSDELDFIYGYCAHILSDIYNNINIWTPFRLKFPEEIKKGYGNLYHTESANIDLQLAQNFINKDKVWSLLKKSHSLTIPDIVLADDIDKIKSNILHVQYNSKSIVDTSKNTLIKYSDVLKFIENAVSFILEKTHNIR